MVQRAIPATVMRGGTSRGVFIMDGEIPESRRDEYLIKIIGSPDPIQVDGLGGGVSSTSKVILISKNDDTGAIDYLFGQVNVDEAKVDYGSNCGNLTAAIGPYAVDNGLFTAPVTDHSVPVEIKLYNINTKKQIISTFDVLNGKTNYSGNNRVQGVPSTGAKVYYRIMDPAGSVTGIPIIEPELYIEIDGKRVQVTVLDATSLYAFIEASALGLNGDELPPDVNSRKEILEKADRVRRQIIHALGSRVPQTKEFEDSQMSLRLILVSKMQGYKNWLGSFTEESEGDIMARAFSLGKLHHAIPFTGALCLAAAAKLPGSVVSKVSRDINEDLIRIAHPKGIATASAAVRSGDGEFSVEYVGGFRTARPIMKGELYIEE